MGDVRSAAAQAGYVDTELLIHETARAFHEAKTPEDLDEEWKRRVRPVYDQLSENALGILNQLYGLNSTIIERRLR